MVIILALQLPIKLFCNLHHTFILLINLLECHLFGLVSSPLAIRAVNFDDRDLTGLTTKGILWHNEQYVLDIVS